MPPFSHLKLTTSLCESFLHVKSLSFLSMLYIISLCSFKLLTSSHFTSSLINLLKEWGQMFVFVCLPFDFVEGLFKKSKKP